MSLLGSQRAEDVTLVLVVPIHERHTAAVPSIGRSAANANCAVAKRSARVRFSWLFLSRHRIPYISVAFHLDVPAVRDGLDTLFDS